MASNSVNNKGGKGDARDGTASSIDRQKQCPFLLRVFVSNSRHNPLKEYNRGMLILWISLGLAFPQHTFNFQVKLTDPKNQLRGTFFLPSRSISPKFKVSWDYIFGANGKSSIFNTSHVLFQVENIFSSRSQPRQAESLEQLLRAELSRFSD